MQQKANREPVLSVQNLCFSYDQKPVLENLNLEVFESEIFCILGSSGCGKSTLLRILAGLTKPSKGQVKFAKPDCKVGFVFQNYALFPHLTVFENIAYGLLESNKEKTKQRVDELAAQFEISELLSKYPSEVSGGQAQRISIARSLAPKPDLLLMDEPFSNLDAKQKSKLKPELLQKLRLANVPTILVTHDQEEAFDIGDRIAVMNEGKFVQVGPTYDIYHEPKCRFAAEFIGTGAFIDAAPSHDGKNIQTALGEIPMPKGCGATSNRKPVELFVRPEDLVHDDDSPDCLEASVVSRQFRGAHSIFRLRLVSGEEVYSLAPSHHLHKPGDKFKVRVELDHVLLFPKNH